MSYAAAGVDYEALDAGKRAALTEALATSAALAHHGGRALDQSRGEPAFVFEFGGHTFAFVLEGLGTKSMIATTVFETMGQSYFDAVAFDAVAAITNDLCCVGALPMVVNAYFATGRSDWYEHADRRNDLLRGWRNACTVAGATWGGGESPSLPELVQEGEIELAGSAIGVVPAGHRPILGDALGAGDEIVFVASTGLHANGASLARMAYKADYSITLANGETVAEALLRPAPIYVPLIAALMQAELPIHYLSHITGHGMLKLMRPRKNLAYHVSELPPVPPVLQDLVNRLEMSSEAAYKTFNMGCGFAVYCAAGSGADVVGAARDLGFDAYVAGRIDAGPRSVVLEQLGVCYPGGDLDLAPRRAA